ncbi:hypothetical protein GUJ93_ZPchr0001g29898 [Zizania palustris]|uniref:Uncharacterized protein n=1 Tax=Zizania palustris TaxID=103762 RepID=A0A8J5RVI7_ZIZPA|nr:hypothetical protein GUJ93_ZPchr0001g29898 [Zizania palustris]
MVFVTKMQCVVRVKGDKDNANANTNAVRVRKGGRKQQHQTEQQQHKWKPKAAMDEDLYKISPKLICRVKKKKLLRNLLGGCLGVNCIA